MSHGNTGGAVFTRYEAMEVLTAGEHSPVSDVFALGILVVELGAGPRSRDSA